MSHTVEILQLIGSPFTSRSYSFREDRLAEIVEVSDRNRMLYFCLQSIGKEKLKSFVPIYEKENAKYDKTNEAIAKVSRNLAGAKIHYVMFKTIRPYTSTTVDLDILILGESNSYAKSIRSMQDSGYELIAVGPKSTTFRDIDADIGIDLYDEIAVSFIIYMDKRTLVGLATTIGLPNGEYVQTLKPEADLACIIAHSVIKEQMYTLSEYYSFIYYLKELNVDGFLKLVRQNNITSATRTHASITALLHKKAHDFVPVKLAKILEDLGQEEVEMTKLLQRNFETPHKYNIITVARSLLEISKGERSRKSMTNQVYQTLHPRFAGKFLRAFLGHIHRETY